LATEKGNPEGEGENWEKREEGFHIIPPPKIFSSKEKIHKGIILRNGEKSTGLREQLFFLMRSIRNWHLSGGFFCITLANLGRIDRSNFSPKIKL